MNRIFTIILCIGLCTFVGPVSSQVSGAAVSLDCGDTTHTPIDPIGNQNYTFECAVSNPTAYAEKIAIQVSSEGFATYGPGDLYVEAGGEESFNVSVLWDPGTYNEERQITVVAQVQELNDMPPPNQASSQYTGTLDLGYNYSQNGCFTQGTLPATDYVTLEIGSGFGNITISLNHTESPITAMNFQLLVAMGCYDNTTFHRVIDDFMIQAGDFTNGDGTGGHAVIWDGYCNGDEMPASTDCAQTQWTLGDEADNGYLHETCTISMAKTSKQHTGGSQFFLIPEDSTPSHLDGVHTVFGKITSGCEHVTAISQVAVAGSQGSTPVDDVTIESATFVGQGETDPWYKFW